MSNEFRGRHVVVGESESGKSTTAEWLLAGILRERALEKRRSRIVILDSWAKIAPKGSCYVDSRLALVRAIRDNRFPIVCTAGFRDFSPMHKLSDLVLLVDEAYRFMTASYCHPSLEAICCGGRHLEQDLIVSTQYPQQLVLGLWINASHAWIHTLHDKRAVAAVERCLSIDLAGRAWRPAAASPTAVLPLHWARRGAHDFMRAAPGAPLSIDLEGKTARRLFPAPSNGGT